MFADRIVKFGERFQGRLDSTLLQGALDYVGYSEESLAFEILCDHICLGYGVLFGRGAIQASEGLEVIDLQLVQNLVWMRPAGALDQGGMVGRQCGWECYLSIL